MAFIMGKDSVKRRKLDNGSYKCERTLPSYFDVLSLETICNILHYLPFYDAVKLERLSRKLHDAVTLHLRLLNEIDFTEGEIYGWMPISFNDLTFKKLLSRCPNLIQIYGLHPFNLSKRRHVTSETLSVPGIVDALLECRLLDYVETSDIFLLEALMTSLPNICVGDFRNRNGHFPVPASNKLNLTRSSTLTTLQLHGVTITDIPRMENLQHLHLRFVKITSPQPFRDLVVPLLRSFVMAHCAGPTDALKYVPMVTGLAAAEQLRRLELIRVPFLGGLFQHVVEDRWRSSGFRSLEKIVFGACKNALEVDLGYLLIACSRRINELCLQPSLTKDSFFLSLIWTEVDFVKFDTLQLGFVDAFPETGKWSNDELHNNHGLADIVEIPAMLTDIGMLVAGGAFTKCKNLSIYNAPHLHHPTSWVRPHDAWINLRYIHIRRCHAVWLLDFCAFIQMLPQLESLFIEEMFREPPRGCSRVGLSAGTGLGVSSALVTNTGNEAPQQANQPQPNNAGAEAANQGEDNMDAAVNQQQQQHQGGPAVVANDNANQNGHAVAENSSGNHEASCSEVVEERVIETEVDGEGQDIDPMEQPSCSKATVLPEDKAGHPQANREKDMEKDIAACSKDEASMEYDIVTIANDPAKCKHCGCTVLAGGGANNGVGGDRAEHGCEMGGKGKGKGKSLRGKKKGIAKGSSGSSRQVHQSCQAIGEEIREASKKAKEQRSTENSQSEERRQLRSDTNTVNQSKSSLQRTETVSNQSRANLQSNGRSSRSEEDVHGRRKKVPTEHKSTSTSDPVIEDDFIPQVLTLRSSSLVNLSLRKVGITSIVLENCPKLQILSACACRVLRGITVTTTTSRLMHTSLIQCPRLQHENAIHQLCSQPAETNRLLFLRPMGQYNQSDMERHLFSNSSYNYHLCILHDFSPAPSQTLYNRRRVASWLDLLSTINFELLRFMDFPEAYSSSGTGLSVYPWHRRLYRMQGRNSNGSRWELLTDIPWLRTLASAPDLPNNRMEPDDFKAGVYSPRAKGHLNPESCLDLLTEDIAEARECQYSIHNYAVVVYVNMCDAFKLVATPDAYV